MKLQKVKQSIKMSLAVALLAGCSKGSTSYSLLTDADDYQQQAVLIPKKIDILWVIDNSGSMKTSQDNLAANFRSFIARFQAKNFDFRMAVTTTEAWNKQFSPNSTLARIKDGAVLQKNPTLIETHSGVFIIDKNTPDLDNVFNTNIKQGTLGDGDERAFESFKQTLLDPWNVNFRRPEAFLAIIIVSDEEDFSGSSNRAEDFEKPEFNYPVQNYVDFLNTYTEASTYGKNYSVSAIYVPDQACKSSLPPSGQKISTRLPELATLTGGAKASLCENFGQSLELISDSIINLASVFKLSREPDISTLSVKVDGVVIPQDSTNGWSYNATDWTITFHGSSIPAANANIQIDFYPKSIKL